MESSRRGVPHHATTTSAAETRKLKWRIVDERLHCECFVPISAVYESTKLLAREEGANHHNTSQHSRVPRLRTKGNCSPHVLDF